MRIYADGRDSYISLCSSFLEDSYFSLCLQLPASMVILDHYCRCSCGYKITGFLGGGTVQAPREYENSVLSAYQGKGEVVNEALLWRMALWLIRMKHERDSGSTSQTPSKEWLESVSRWQFFYVFGACS